MSGAGRAQKRAAPPIEYSLLLTATLCLLAFGAVMVFSASSARSLLSSGGNGFYYLERTLVFGAIGLAVMRIASVRGIAAVRVMTPLILVSSLFLLLVVLLPGVGTQVNGAQRWVGGGFFRFQPSELAKIALVLYGAYLLSAEPKRARTLAGLGPYLLDRRRLDAADRQGARPGHGDHRRGLGLLHALRGGRSAAHPGAGRHRHRRDRPGDDRDSTPTRRPVSPASFIPAATRAAAVSRRSRRRSRWDPAG